MNDRMMETPRVPGGRVEFPKSGSECGPIARPCRVGVIGVGGMGLQQVARLLTNPQKWDIAGVVDTSSLSYAAFQCRFYGKRIPFYRDPRDLLARTGADAIVVSTLAPSHIHVAEELIEAGFHGPMLIEKPISNRLEQITRLSSILREKRWCGRIGVDFQRRCSDLYLSIKRTVNSPQFGRLKRITVRKAGRISMNGSHFIDLGIFLTQSRPTWVAAHLDEGLSRDRRGAWVIDPPGHIEIGFEGGMLLEMELRLPHSPEDLIRIEGEHGAISISAGERNVALSQSIVGASIEIDGGAMDWFEKALDALVLKDATRPLCDLEQAAWNLEAVVGAFESSRIGGLALAMPLDPLLRSAVLEVC